MKSVVLYGRRDCAYSVAAKELLRVINISKLEGAYRLRLDPKTSHLQWLTLEDDKEVVLGVEPESSFWLRVHNMLLGWFVPEKLL